MPPILGQRKANHSDIDLVTGSLAEDAQADQCQRLLEENDQEKWPVNSNGVVIVVTRS